MSSPHRDGALPGRGAVEHGLTLGARRVATPLSTALLIAFALSAGTSYARSAQQSAATAARQSFFYENARLHLTSETSDSLSERGYATGTYDAPVASTFHISPGHDIKASYAIYPRGGSISGGASARYVIKGNMGYFGGYMTITKATGRFRGTSGRSIGFSGTINRSSFAVTVKVHGWLSKTAPAVSPSKR